MAQAQLGTLSQTTLLSATTGKLDVCLLPLWQKKLLLPASTMLEVLSASEMRAVKKGKKTTVLGHVKWEDQQIPVISFETLNGDATPPTPQKLAIIFGVGLNEKLPHYAIALQSEPEMVKVKIAQLEDLEKAPVGPMEYLQVRYQDSLVIIPDLDAIEAKILSLL
jgi:chemosensory pili system protein ChpC